MIYIIHRKDELVEDLKKQVLNSQELVKNIKFIEVSLINNNIILKFLRKIYIFFKIPRKDIWLNKKELKEIVKEDILIFFDTYTFEYLDLANKLENKKKIWLWNQLDKSKYKYIDSIKKEFKDEIWSFDIKDCKKEGFNFLPQFYWREKDKKKILENNDLLFIGRDKGRYNLLKNILNSLEEKGVSTTGYILKEKFKVYPDHKYIMNKFLKYSEVVELVKKSKCLLDINKDGQEGLTLRVMESIFFEKKLITNNKKIINYDFYTPENIYILDDLINIDYLDIIKFINTPFQKMEERIIKKYTFEFWLDNILKETR